MIFYAKATPVAHITAVSAYGYAAIYLSKIDMMLSLSIVQQQSGPSFLVPASTSKSYFAGLTKPLGGAQHGSQ
jgi:hypothetical protein